MERIDKSYITTAKDVEAMKLIKAYAEFLKRSGKIELPKLHDIMRTCVFSDYIPLDDDWYYVRCGIAFSYGFTISRSRSPPVHETWYGYQVSERPLWWKAPQWCAPCLPRSCRIVDKS